jgi:hypothetical protein
LLLVEREILVVFIINLIWIDSETNNAFRVNIVFICRLLLDNSFVIVLYLPFPFSLTKYSAIFAEVKGCFGIVDLVGDAHAPSDRNASEADLTLNLNSALKKAEAALTEAVIFGAISAPSKFEIRMNLTTSWKELSLKEVDLMKVLCPCTTIWNTLHKSFLFRMDTSIKWKMGYVVMLCSNVNATNSCRIDAPIIGTWSCKENSIAGSSFGTGRCFAGLSFVGPFENSFVTDATTILNVAEDLSLKEMALLFETDATTNWNEGVDLSHLIWVVEVMGLHTNDAKMLHETFVMKVTGSRANNAEGLHKTFFVEVTDSNSVWEWTQQ